MSTNEFDIRNIRLLLVEDNPADARVVERHLKDAGLNEVISDWVQTAGEATERLPLRPVLQTIPRDNPGLYDWHNASLDITG